ncbi:MAG: histidine--tRNA ligase [Candidatus Omnitrophota bacterium]
MIKTYKSVRGTYDFSPSEANLFSQVAESARDIFHIFGYEEIILPLIEEEGVFIRSVGETTDIVEKQIFRIAKRSEEDDSIVLRPEGTAQVVRYYLENSIYKQNEFSKFFYIGPMFRGERPQKGRLRQFNHIGAEAMGSKSVFLDAEIISLAMKILERLGISQVKLQINTLGCQADKEKFKELLKEELSGKQAMLCEDCKRRLKKNPLRILDCKEEQCKRIAHEFCVREVNDRPYLCDECKKEFNDLMAILKDSGLQAVYNPCLVRGLDYYTNTVFEITSESLGSQDAIGAGGRYNNLISNLGGPEIPAIGFALGVERVLLALNKKGAIIPQVAFVALTGEKLLNEAYSVLQSLRNANISSDMIFCAKSLKGQFRYAERKSAGFVVIVAEEEYKEGFVLLKNMKTGEQEKIKKEMLISVLRGHIAKAKAAV